jgi:hypothetical protein
MPFRPEHHTPTGFQPAVDSGDPFDQHPFIIFPAGRLTRTVLPGFLEKWLFENFCKRVSPQDFPKTLKNG